MNMKVSLSLNKKATSDILVSVKSQDSFSGMAKGKWEVDTMCFVLL